MKITENIILIILIGNFSVSCTNQKLMIDNANAKKPLAENLTSAQGEATKTLEAQGLKVVK